ncbi:MAG: group III truncated hemoglobin [Gemmatimonadetes bacterium]|nr:group III truncated hemoglobin [Gemmatimonadota bacterium]
MLPRITEQEIRDLVFAFYERVREDELLGPVFEARLEGRWAPHLEKMCDFWSSILLATGRFSGNPAETHARVPGISPAHFDRWLELFQRTAGDTLRPHIAADVVGPAHRMRVVLERAADAGSFSPRRAAQRAPHPS